MPRFKLVIEYTGTRYSGWQIQKNARTVAGEIDAAAREVTGRRDFELYGSGRTDAGVHASGQVAHLDVATSLPADVLRRRLNDDLPADINILSAGVVPHRFHARHDATGRTYLYQIARRRTAFAKPYVWWVREPLDLGAMREAAGALLGLRDFKAFAVTEDDDRDRRDGRSRSTHVLVERLDIIEQGSLVLLRVDGTHMQTSFGHLDGYSAIYYTYMWSLVMAKDLFSQFDPANLLAPDVARRYRERVLAPGGSKPAADLVKDFLGRPADFKAWEAWLNRR